MEGTCGHYAGNGTAAAAESARNNERKNGFTLKPESTEKPVKNKSYSCDVSGILQRGNEDEHQKYQRKKAHYSANAAYYAVFYHRFEDIGLYICRGCFRKKVEKRAE